MGLTGKDTGFFSLPTGILSFPTHLIFFWRTDVFMTTIKEKDIHRLVQLKFSVEGAIEELKKVGNGEND